MKYFFIILIGLVISIFIFTSRKNADTQQTAQQIYATPTYTETPIDDKASSSRYVLYSPLAFEAAKGKKRVYFFHASWCPTCKVTNTEFLTSADAIPVDVIVFKTDYDKETALKKQFAITYQHTFVLVDEAGNQIKLWNGGGLNELITNTK